MGADFCLRDSEPELWIANLGSVLSIDGVMVSSSPTEPHDANEACRQRILEAAPRLVRQGGGDALAMGSLAREAGVPEVALYKLFGSRFEVIDALLRNAINAIVKRSVEQAPADDPLEQLILGHERLADVLLEDKRVLPELIRAARASSSKIGAHLEYPTRFILRGLRGLAEAGHLKDDVSLKAVARHIALSNLGAIDAWLMGNSDEVLLRRDLQGGLLLAIACAATPEVREQLLRRVGAKK